MAKECPMTADTETISTLSAHSETRAVNVLQIANGYLGSKLYTHLFSALEKHGVENKVYVPVRYGMEIPSNMAKNVTVSPCFTQLDRLIFFSSSGKCCVICCRWQMGLMSFTRILYFPAVMWRAC